MGGRAGDLIAALNILATNVLFALPLVLAWAASPRLPAGPVAA